jgi:hypothetical protein
MISRLAAASLALSLALSGCASVTKAHLPGAPEGAELVRDAPIFCSDRVLYIHVYDTNPATQAGVAMVGPTNEQHTHGAPFLVIIIGDAGAEGGDVAMYVSVDGSAVEKLTIDEYRARYGEGMDSACRLAQTVRS